MEAIQSPPAISILHLEDDPLDADLVREFLQADGLACIITRVWTRETFVEALAAAAYDVILADHNLPSFDGETALSIAAHTAPNASFIFLSGTLGEDVAVEAMKRGATDYVVKQNIEKLPNVVRRAINEVQEKQKRRRAEEALRETERKFRAELERQVKERSTALLQAEQTLQQAQKLDAIGKLTGGVAHDFNNLLSAILGSLELLRRRMPADPDLLRLLDNAVAGAERGAGLTRRMLAFARRQELKAEPIDMEELTRGMADLLQRSIGPMIAMELRFPAALPLVSADTNQLESALLNLVLNGRDAMAGNGRLVIGAREERLTQSRSGLAPGHYVSLFVQDFGRGMDAETASRAAEPFFTTKGVGKGTGLGLSMVQGLAEQSGGALRLQTEPGKGTTAEIWLPVVAKVEADAARGPAEVQAPDIQEAVHPLTILAVDDDALVLMNTVDMLEEMGHRVVSANSGREALAQILRTKIDLVVTDHAMPQMTGADLAREIKTRYPDLPILLATGYAELPANVEILLPRLSKPFSQQDLASAIHRMMMH